MTHIYRLMLLIFSPFALSAQADDLDNGVSYQSGWHYINTGDDLIVNIPAQATLDLLSRLQKLRSKLNEQKLRLMQDSDNTTFTATDAILALLMPGGLLYAAHKKQRHSDSMKNLEMVSLQLDGFEGDIDFLKTVYSNATLASR